jgi:O-antigen ligase
VSILLLAALLMVLGVHLIPFALILGATALLWLLFQHPLGGLGIFLAFMPVFPMAFMLGEFFGPPSVTLFSPCDRVAMVLATLILLGRNGIKLTSADWFLVACFGLAVIRLAFGGALIALLSDFNLMFAYAAGRVVVLTANQETLWARRAVWIVAVLSVLGLAEVFVFGEGPRTLLYLSVASSTTMQGRLAAPFHADGYSGLREAATMIGPLQFAPLCMAALIIWWVYCRKPWPAGMIAAGLICSVTRSAWLGTALAIPLLAIIMEQKRRFFLYVALFMALFVASVPLLGFGDYLLLAKSGQDYSTEGHQESLRKGWEYVWDHPFGLGPGNAGSYASKNNSNEVSFESTYLTFAAEYGVLATLCFLGFLVSALRLAWRSRTHLGYVAVGILVGFGAVMMFAPLHLDFSLATWIWFPVGLAVRSSIALRDRETGGGMPPLPFTL